MRQEARAAVGRRRAGHACPTTSSRSSPRSASWPGPATRSTSAAASACACRSATSRCSAPTRCAAACAPASTSVVPRVCDLEALAASTQRQDRDRVARGGPRRRDPREPRQGRGAHRVQGAGHARSGARRRSPRSRRASSPTPARTSRRPTRRGSSSRSPPCAPPCPSLTGGDESPAAVAAAVEFVLEGLHLSKRLNKDASARRRHLPQPQLTPRHAITRKLVVLTSFERRASDGFAPVRRSRARAQAVDDRSVSTADDRQAESASRVVSVADLVDHVRPSVEIGARGAERDRQRSIGSLIGGAVQQRRSRSGASLVAMPDDIARAGQVGHLAIGAAGDA